MRVKRQGTFWPVVVGLGLLLCVPAAWAETFDLPPEQNAPQWFTQFPYQRNLDWTFDDPDDPLTPYYQGYDDDVLSLSDYVELTGDVQWFSEVETSFGTYTGVIGIDNRGGPTSLSGTAIFHIDNWDTPFIKHIWEEVDYYTPRGKLCQSVNLPFGFSVTDAWASSATLLSQDPDLCRRNAWLEIDPNPPWEEKVLHFEAPGCTFVFLDRFHLATECAIPEPATVVNLLGLGTLIALLGVYRWRRRR